MAIPVQKEVGFVRSGMRAANSESNMFRGADKLNFKRAKEVGVGVLVGFLVLGAGADLPPTSLSEIPAVRLPSQSRGSSASLMDSLHRPLQFVPPASLGQETADTRTAWKYPPDSDRDRIVSQRDVRQEQPFDKNQAPFSASVTLPELPSPWISLLAGGLCLLVLTRRKAQL